MGCRRLHAMGTTGRVRRSERRSMRLLTEVAIELTHLRLFRLVLSRSDLIYLRVVAVSLLHEWTRRRLNERRSSSPSPLHPSRSPSSPLVGRGDGGRPARPLVSVVASRCTSSSPRHRLHTSPTATSEWSGSKKKGKKQPPETLPDQSHQREGQHNNNNDSYNHSGTATKKKKHRHKTQVRAR